jgi:hypothetical protein
MKMHRPLLVRALLPLCAVAVGVTIWASTQPADAAFTSALSAAQVAVRGTVAGGSESVAFSGSVKIDSKMVTDPDFGGPSTVVLSIDLGGVSGTGLSTKAQYVTSSREILERRLAATDKLDIVFPFYQSGTRATASTRVGKASLALSFNTSTGMLIGGSGSVTSP